jgi:2-dehydro-3-deoxyphosphogluconate aldolase / (4S)-4-hydroxy-2-oxoglutarate aldolase
MSDPSLVGDIIALHRLIPVVVLDTAGPAERLGRALLAGGLPLAEITFRTDAAEAAITALAADPRLLIGAGTVIHPSQVERAVAAGARFIVSPGFNPHVVARARELGVLVIPGVATATEIMTALDAGLQTVKLFPAESAGGPAAVKALSAPFPGLRFVPTGGITQDSMPRYLAHPAVTAVGGSWMVAPELIRAGRFDEITRISAEAVRLAVRVRAIPPVATAISTRRSPG